MTTPHIMFRDESGKLHATPALSLASDLGTSLGSEVFARRALECRAQLREAFDRADLLEAEFSEQLGAQKAYRTRISPQHHAAIQGDDDADLPRAN